MPAEAPQQGLRTAKILLDELNLLGNLSAETHHPVPVLDGDLDCP